MKKIISLSAILISTLGLAQTECMDLTNYTDQYLDFVSSDDATFPSGAAFITTGGLNYIKIDDTDVYQTISGDTLTFSGNIGINAQFFDCSISILELSFSNPVGMVIDGTIVFSGGNPPSTFTGPTFTFTSLGNNSYTIEGFFTNVVLTSPSTQLYDVCFTCEGMGIDELYAAQIKAFPNPTSGQITFELPESARNLSFYDVRGVLICEYPLTTSSTQLDIEALPSGTYQAVCKLSSGKIARQLILKN